MNTLVSTLKNSRVGKLPQIGLRLVNKLQEGHTSEKFWLDYIEFVRNPENFRKLSPHSKCLLTCVVTKMERDLFKKTRSRDLVHSIYSDVINKRSIFMLNLELINMILVSSYTLRIPLSDNQLDLVLLRANEDMCKIFSERKEGVGEEDEQRYRFPVEHSVAIIHSLASLTRCFPSHLEKVRDSDAINSVVSRLESLLGFVNAREFSMILFSFDKLKLLTDDTGYKFYKFAQKIDDFDSQSLTTSFYISSNNVKLKNLFGFLMPRVDSMIMTGSSSVNTSHNVDNSNVARSASERKTLTGRECCNILYSLLRRNSFKDRHYRFLVERAGDMNLQELCNMSSLLLSKNYPVGDDFKRVFVNKLVGTDFSNVVVLDLLTIANCFHAWKIENELVLKRMVAGICNNGNFIFGDKSVLLLHYLVQLKYNDLGSLLKLFDKEFDSSRITTFHHILLYNSINTLRVHLNCGSHGPGEEVESRLSTDASVLHSILEKVQNKLASVNFGSLTRLDLLTLGKFYNLQILERLAEFLKDDTWSHMDICLNMLKYNSDAEIAKRVNMLIINVDADRAFMRVASTNSRSRGDLNGEMMKFNHFLTMVVLLKNIDVLKRVLNSAIAAKCSDFEVILSIVNSCKKLHFLDENVKKLLESLVKSFHSSELLGYFSCVDALTSVKLYNVKNMISDFVNVLYHFDYRNDSNVYDHSLSRSLNTLHIESIYSLTNNNINNNRVSVSNSISGNIDANTPLKVAKKNVVGYTDGGNAIVECKILDDRTIYESLLVSISNLCFNAVVHPSVLMKFIRHHIHSLNAKSPTILKCLATDTSILKHFTLRELLFINGIQQRTYTHLIETNDVHTSVLATLVNLGINSVAEYQVLDYRIDLLIL
ncbi:conserved hypothetical protein [Theileria orientalis strain Shintoku]|uniref:Uncharacterized protein n=1 Tax=Theileria orientalis strain Shintoku TaxID=869250 RepID=J4D731_THEOR|nr:conserved hypothetical protein [Theileria orientalis strain Shintoku]BAM39930.1 conserved hypothetical protein [Theileria orientalis strain Shintoku]|eukprot:XP_009690231.1 conserved hypothetical protein [Theileria orientalis strain Shintoku]